MWFFVIASTFVVQSTAPPLSPAEALKVFTASSQSRFVPPPPLPQPSIVIRSKPGSGPFGELRSTPLPVSCCSVYVHPRTPEVIVQVKGGK